MRLHAVGVPAVLGVQTEVPVDPGTERLAAPVLAGVGADAVVVLGSLGWRSPADYRSQEHDLTCGMTPVVGVWSQRPVAMPQRW